MDVSSQSAALHVVGSLDIFLLFSKRSVRLHDYDSLSVVLVLYLSASGLHDDRIGLLLSLTLPGYLAVSLPITTWVDRSGLRPMWMFGAVLMIFATVLSAVTKGFARRLVAAMIGVIGRNGCRIGPFVSNEHDARSASMKSLLDDDICAVQRDWLIYYGGLAYQ